MYWRATRCTNRENHCALRGDARCIARIHLLLPGFTGRHAINHGRCGYFHPGCAGVNAFFNKVDVGHARAHLARVRRTWLCKSVKVIDAARRTCTSVTAALHKREHTVAVDTWLVCTMLILYLYYSRLPFCPPKQACWGGIYTLTVCLIPFITHRHCNTDCNCLWSRRSKLILHFKLNMNFKNCST